MFQRSHDEALQGDRNNVWVCHWAGHTSKSHWERLTTLYVHQECIFMQIYGILVKVEYICVNLLNLLIAEQISLHFFMPPVLCRWPSPPWMRYSNTSYKWQSTVSVPSCPLSRTTLTSVRPTQPSPKHLVSRSRRYYLKLLMHVLNRLVTSNNSQQSRHAST